MAEKTWLPNARIDNSREVGPSAFTIFCHLSRWVRGTAGLVDPGKQTNKALRELTGFSAETVCAGLAKLREMEWVRDAKTPTGRATLQVVMPAEKPGDLEQLELCLAGDQDSEFPNPQGPQRFGNSESEDSGIPNRGFGNSESSLPVKKDSVLDSGKDSLCANRRPDPEGFTEFWARYKPFQDANRKAAVDAWKALQLDTDSVKRDEVMEGLGRWEKSQQWNRSDPAVPHAHRWLKNERWREHPRAGILHRQKERTFQERYEERLAQYERDGLGDAL